MLIYRLLADAVVVVHAGFVAFVVFGLAAILLGAVLNWGWIRNFWFRIAHLTAIGVVVVQALCGVICPLTILENWLRRGAGEATYPGSFVAYWAHHLLFYDAQPWVFTVGYCLFGAAVLATLFFCPPRWPRRSEAVAQD